MLDKHWLSTCAPLGTVDSASQSWRALGAGVFIYDDPFIWYVTIKNLINLPVHILINHSKTERCLVDVQSLHKIHHIEWAVDSHSDLAATLFPADPNFNIKAVHPSSFMHSKDMFPSMICYSVGYPYSVVGFDIEKIIPCVQDGIISGIDSRQRHVYVTVPTFPGNSGGPLFTGNGVVHLGGIISEYVLVGDGQTSSLPPMYLGKVIPSEDIQSLLNSPKSEELKKKMKNN